MTTPLAPLLLKGDCLVELARIPDASVDSIVTDPPYGLEFMGKGWDSFRVDDRNVRGYNGRETGSAGSAVAQSGSDVQDHPAKRGSAVAYGGGKRGTTSRCEGCGKRDQFEKPHACPSGTNWRREIVDPHSAPPSMLAFEEWTRLWAAECYRILKPGGHMLAFGGSRTWHRLAAGIEDAGFEIRDSIAWLYGSGFPKSMDVSKAIDRAAGATREKVPATGGLHNNANLNDDAWSKIGSVAPTMEGPTPATDAAREWEGWGTALKPAFEPIVVARKPLGEKTVAANVLAHGTGALNIDATRIAGTEDTARPQGKSIRGGQWSGDGGRSDLTTGGGTGRWPANVVLDEDQAAALDAQTGILTSGKLGPGHVDKGKARGIYGEQAGRTIDRVFGNDSGGASRFFYVAKAPKSERPVVDGTAHPTVKPLALMRWLIRLVTPPGGCVVDPFAGSGTTLEAAYLEGFESIGCEMTPDYWPLIAARIERVTR